MLSRFVKYFLSVETQDNKKEMSAAWFFALFLVVLEEDPLVSIHVFTY